MDEKYLPTTLEGKLWRFAEECAELSAECGRVVEACNRAIKAAAKAGRFGLEGDHLAPVIGTTPRERLVAEMADLEHAIAALRKEIGL